MFDGDTFELFLDKVGGHKRCNINYDPSHLIKQGLDYLGFIDVYHERIKAFHVKDAEFNPTAKQGYLGGYKGWLERAARDRSLGDGQVNFKGIFSRFAAYDFAGWAVYEWECCLQHPEVGRAQRRQVHQRPYHRGDGPGLRQFRGHRREPGDQSEAPRAGSLEMVYATAEGAGLAPRLRYGMVGGGRDAFIGAVHRMAMRLDDRCELVAGALSSDPEKARLSGARHRHRAGAQLCRFRGDGRGRGGARRRHRGRGHRHAQSSALPIARAFLDAGIDVICDKPLSATLAEAEELVTLVRQRSWSSP